MQKCYLALGCFWKPEENFRTKPGIISTEVGYAGGDKPQVSYEEVCAGNTKHAETVKIEFDENIITYEKILDLFFKLHDPTQKNMQLPDIGDQYRSEIFYSDEDQKDTAKKVIEKFDKIYNGKIATNVSKLKNYCKAEEYHQKYILKNRS